MKAIFFEAWSDRPAYGKDGGDIWRIALTPGSAHRLRESRLSFNVPEDFCSLDEQAARSDIFYEKFCAWVKEVDGIVRRKTTLLPEGFNPVSPIAYQLNNILEPWFNQLYILDRVFERLKAKGVTSLLLIGSPRQAYLPAGAISPCWTGESLYRLFFCELASSHGLKAEIIIADTPPPYVPPHRKVSWNRVERKLKKIWCNLLVAIESTFACRQRGRVIYTPKDQLSVNMQRKLLKGGFNIRNISFKRGSAGEGIAIDFEEIRDILGIFGELNRVEFPLWMLVSIQNFLEKTCSDMLEVIRIMECMEIDDNSLFLAQYSQNFPYNYINEYFRVRNLPRAVLFHGDSFYVCNYWDIAEMQYADIYIVTNELYEKTLRDLYKGITYLTVDSKYEGIEKKKSVYRSSTPATVLYLPTIFRGADTRFFKNAMDYPPAWYYNVQRTILDWLVQNGYHVIYKAFPGDSSFNPFTQADTPGGMTVSHANFTETFGTFDLMITDFPSTGMLECIYAGVPCASLYPASMPLLPHASQLVGKVLFPFQKVEDIPRALHEILDKTMEELRIPVQGLFPDSDEIKEKRVRDMLDCLASFSVTGGRNGERR